MSGLIAQWIKQNDLLYQGKIAYGNINTGDKMLRKMIIQHEYPVYSTAIILGGKSSERNKYWQRVPNLDIVDEPALQA